ncbi:hypothetical protein D3C87_1684370 [compost metagenome]
MSAFAECEMQRDGRSRFRHGDGNAVIAHQQIQLFDQVMAEQFWPRHGRRVDAGGRDMAVGKPRIGMAERGRFDRDLRIEGAITAGHRAALGQRAKTVDQEFRITLIKRGQGIDSRLGIVESLRFHRARADVGKRRKGRDSCVHEPL